MSDNQISDEDLRHVADILMGAAHADGRYERQEADAIKKTLAELMQDEPLPDVLDEYLELFEPETFELKQSIAALNLDQPEQRRFLLKLVARVTEVDDVHDLDETAYIVQVARAAGASPDEYADLAVEYSSGDDEGSTPPPVPLK